MAAHGWRCSIPYCSARCGRPAGVILRFHFHRLGVWSVFWRVAAGSAARKGSLRFEMLFSLAAFSACVALSCRRRQTILLCACLSRTTASLAYAVVMSIWRCRSQQQVDSFGALLLDGHLERGLPPAQRCYLPATSRNTQTKTLSLSVWRLAPSWKVPVYLLEWKLLASHMGSSHLQADRRSPKRPMLA